MKDIHTGLVLSPVPTDYLDIVWSSVAKVLKKSVGTARGKYEVDDLYPLLKDEELVLWVVSDQDGEVVAAITTRLILYPQASAMAMDWIGGTRMKEWLPMAQERISEHARRHNCKYLEGYGRKGWDRWLRKYGWKPDYIAYKMELD